MSDPSRVDDTLYRASDGTLEVMRGGQRLVVPDLTTLRSLGLFGHPIVPISDADRATIPAGAPLPSTSWFARPPLASVPIAFLPLRIETHFATTDGQPQLWIRVFPDQVHVDSFEPALTAAESSARTAYLADPDATAADADVRLAAWRRLAQRFGAARAAWIVSPAAASPGSKAADWTSPATTTLLPDRFIFCAYDAEGGVVRQAGQSVPDPLVLGPSPGGGDPSTDQGLLWTRDFQHAVDLGMAIRLPISAAQAANGFVRVVVFGVRSQLDPQAGAQRLAAALDAHHFTDGIELLPHGTPTNNAEGARSGYRGDDPGFARSFEVERGPARTPSPDGRGDGDRLASALGIPGSHFAFVRGAEGRHDDPPAAMHTLLWPATLGYYLANLVAAAISDQNQPLVPAARSHFISWVRARGPWPTLRIGRQPYGVAPVVWSAGYQPRQGDALAGPLLSVLQTLRPFWQTAVGQVERVGSGTDPDATLAAVLGLSPTTTGLVARAVLGREFHLNYWNSVGLGRFVDAEWFAHLADLATQQLGPAAQLMATTRLANATYLDAHVSLSPRVVAAPLTDAPLSDNYLQAFGSLGAVQLRDAATPPAPAPLLWLLARHAALRQYAESAYEVLGSAVPPAQRVEPELIDISPTPHTPRLWDHLNLPLPQASGTVGEYLDHHKADGPAAFVQFWRALGALSGMSTRQLDWAVREALDLCSYRLDAWYTSLATERLDSLRQAPTNQATLYLGAYGWVETVRPGSGTPSWGYVHAPSLAHATTAAVLRSGYLTHQTTGSGAAAVDLSSARVRSAETLLDGVRSGQALGSLLGYQFERALHVRTLDAYIDSFREFAPVEAAAGDAVVDGLSLLNRRADLPWGAKVRPSDQLALPAAGDPAQAGLVAELDRLADTLDAVADLLLAESVHQLASGNVVRSGATVDALGRGESPPPRLEVTRTPRRGAVVTHRLLVLLPDGPAQGWPASPRGRAEPRLDALVATLLGPPDRVQARAQLVGASGAPLASLTLTLADLGLGPLDVLALREPGPGAAGQAEIEQRLAYAAWSRRPSGTPEDARVVVDLHQRDPTATPDRLSFDDLLVAVDSARALLATARGATAADFGLADQPVDPGLDAPELQARADQAVAALTAARARLDDGSTSADVALGGAAAFGVMGAVPSVTPGDWPAQAALVRGELDSRLAALAALDSGFSRAGTPAEAQCAHDLARLRVVFGPDVQAAARLRSDAAATLGPLFAGSPALLRNQPLEAVTWLLRVARVRHPAARLAEALTHAEALGSGARLDLSVAQLPATPNDVWAGLSLPEAAQRGNRVSLVALGPAGAAQAGLFVDEWLETIPNAAETTGVSFHINDATSRAPQTILLAVQPDEFPEWTLESVEGTLLEAVELSHMRAVDPELLAGIGHFLPALLFAINLADGTPDAVSSDFTLAAVPPPATRVDVTRAPILDVRLPGG